MLKKHLKLFKLDSSFVGYNDKQVRRSLLSNLSCKLIIALLLGLTLVSCGTPGSGDNTPDFLAHVYSVDSLDILDNLAIDKTAYQLDGAFSVTQAEVGGSNYMFVAGRDDDGVSVFRVAEGGSLTHVDSVDDAEDDAYELDGAYSVTTAVVGGTSYLFVGGFYDDGVSVFSIADNGSLTHVDSVDDAEDNAYQLDGTASVTTAVVGGTSYLFVGGWYDHGVSVFSISANGSLTHVDSLDDSENNDYLLRRASSVTTAVIGGTSYLFISGWRDNGVSVFSVADDGSLSHVDSVVDAEDNAYQLDGTESVTTAVVGGTSYLFVAGFGDDGVSVFRVAEGGSLTHVDSVDDAEDDAYELAGASSVAIAAVGEASYLFVAGFDDDGVSVFSIAVDGSLTYVDSVDDSENPAYKLDSASSVTAAIVGGTSYLFVAGGGDDGVSVFSIADNGYLTYVDSVDGSENPAYQLDAAQSVTAAIVGETSYLFIAGRYDDGVSVFRVSADGYLVNVDSVDDIDDIAYEISGASSVTTAVVGGSSYLFVAGLYDDGVSVFRVAEGGSLIHVDSVDDLENAAYQLEGARSVTTAVVGGASYLFVAGRDDHGVSVFNITTNGYLTHVDSINNTEYELEGTDSVTNATNGSLTHVDSVNNTEYELEGTDSVTTAVVGETSYLFVAGFHDDGVSVFSISDNGSLTHVDSVNDSENDAYELDGAYSVTTAVVGGASYLFVGGWYDDGVSVFSIADDGFLTHVYSVNNAAYELDGVSSVTTAVVGDRSYLFVAGLYDHGVSMFRIAEDGSLTHVDSVDDGEDYDAYELAGASSVTTAVVGGTSYLFVTGRWDNGVSVFRISQELFYHLTR